MSVTYTCKRYTVLMIYVSLPLCFCCHSPPLSLSLSEFLAVIRAVGNKDVLTAGSPRWRFSSFFLSHTLNKTVIIMSEFIAAFLFVVIRERGPEYYAQRLR